MNGPFVEVVLWPDAGYPGFPSPPTLQNGAPIQFGNYPSTFLVEDQSNPNLKKAIGTGAPYFINVIVFNRGTLPSAVAADIVIKTSIFFGGQVAPHHPFQVNRDFTFTTLRPNVADAARLFNVNGLTNYQVQIREVAYRDITGRDRRSATGLGMITVDNGGPIETLVKLFKPRKGEYTDGIRD